MEFITQTNSYNTGGGCMVDVLTLEDGRVLCVTDDYVGLYHSVNDMLEDDGTKCIKGFWITKNLSGEKYEI
tara:strand:+ start:917 stop:1129 length:213 start_codon:yes stop_codon:yes gene_type:complete